MGTLRIVLARPVAKPPFFSIIKIFLLEKPDLDFDITGAVGLLNLLGFQTIK